MHRAASEAIRGPSCKLAVNTCPGRGGGGFHSGSRVYVFIVSTLQTELNSLQQKNKDSSELYCNSLREIYEYYFPVKSSIFLFTTCNLHAA